MKCPSALFSTVFSPVLLSLNLNSNLVASQIAPFSQQPSNLIDYGRANSVLTYKLKRSKTDPEVRDFLLLRSQRMSPFNVATLTSTLAHSYSF